MQLTGAAFGQVHVPPPVVTTATENKRCVRRRRFRQRRRAAIAGTVIEHGLRVSDLSPAVTGLGLPLFVTVRSQTMLTFVTTDRGARVHRVRRSQMDVAVIVAATTLDGTFTTTTMLAVSPTAKLGSVQVTVPVAADRRSRARPPRRRQHRLERRVQRRRLGETRSRCRSRTVVRHGLRISDVVSRQHVSRASRRGQHQIRLGRPATMSVATAEFGSIRLVRRIHRRRIRDDGTARRSDVDLVDDRECSRDTRAHARVRARARRKSCASPSCRRRNRNKCEIRGRRRRLAERSRRLRPWYRYSSPPAYR